MSTDPMNVGLPKWPASVIVGDRVTREQAQEIIVRTDPWSFDSNSNDEAFSTQLWGALGLKCEDRWGPKWEDRMNIRAEYGVLDLEYLHNAQIISAWIGGPHGWCGWNGAIFSNNSNIGKWPSVDEVFNEWQTIAHAFPYLSLKHQLYDAECGEDDAKPVVQFDVLHGQVTALIPDKALVCPMSIADNPSMLTSRLTNPMAERGCTITQFKEALEVTKRRLGQCPEALEAVMTDIGLVNG